MVNIKCNFETALLLLLLCTGHAPRLAGFSFPETAPLVVKAESYLLDSQGIPIKTVLNGKEVVTAAKNDTYNSAIQQEL